MRNSDIVMICFVLAAIFVAAASCGNYREVTAGGFSLEQVQKEVWDRHVADLATSHEAGRQAMKAELAASILGRLGLA